MADWRTLIAKELTDRFGTDLSGVEARCAWVPQLAQKAAVLLQPQALRAMPPAEVYDRLRELGIPECPIRIAHLGRVNDAGRIVEALLRLLETPGGLEEKFRAAKFPQAGIVTLTELLCVARPLRFICRNTLFTRALAKIIPLYSAKALQELPYEEFLDLCREPLLVLEAAAGNTGQWAKEYRYLLLYAAVTAA